jgi:hypothetical protein
MKTKKLSVTVLVKYHQSIKDNWMPKLVKRIITSSSIEDRLLLNVTKVEELTK